MGGLVKRFYSLITGPGNGATTCNIVSTLKRTHLSFTSDESQIEDLDAFMARGNQMLEELGIVYDSDEEGSD